MKATKQDFPVLLFIMLYKVVLPFESVDEILKCDHSNESYWAVLSCGAVYYAVQGGSTFWVCVTIQMKAIESVDGILDLIITLTNHWLSSSISLTGLFWLFARMAWAVGTRLSVRGLFWSVRACARIAKEDGREAAAIFNAIVISSSVTWMPSRYSRFFSLPRARILKVSGYKAKQMIRRTVIFALVNTVSCS